MAPHGEAIAGCVGVCSRTNSPSSASVLTPDAPCRWVFLSPLLAIAAPQVCPFPFPGATKVAAAASVGSSPLRDHQVPSVHHVGVIVLQVSLSNPLPQKDR